MRRYRTLGAAVGSLVLAAVLALGADVAPAWGLLPPTDDLLLVPLTTGEMDVGTLVLLDPDGETADDRLLGAYASRAAAAYLHAVRLRSGLSAVHDVLDPP